MGPLKRRLSVPASLTSCHTAEIDGFVIEGHVPARAIRRLLAERPPAIGLAVPGMPVGSPGMEAHETPPEPTKWSYSVQVGRGSSPAFKGSRNLSYLDLSQNYELQLPP